MKAFPCAKRALACPVCELSSLGLKLMPVAFAAFDKTNKAKGKMILLGEIFFFFQLGYRVPAWYKSLFTNWARLDKPFHPG